MPYSSPLLNHSCNEELFPHMFPKGLGNFKNLLVLCCLWTHELLLMQCGSVSHGYSY